MLEYRYLVPILDWKSLADDLQRYPQTRNGEKPVSPTSGKYFLTLTPPVEISTRSQVPPEEKLHGIKEVNGVKYGEDVILGVPVLLPA